MPHRFRLVHYRQLCAGIIHLRYGSKSWWCYTGLKTIYNVVDNIQEDALQHLSLFVEYGRLAMTEAQRFGKPFQTLVFCVRDFRNPEEYGYGEEGGTKFLQQVLKGRNQKGLHMPNPVLKPVITRVTPDQPEELRSVREQLSDCFEQISCFLLPYPGYRVAERQSFRGHVKDLRPIFREEMKKMIPALLNPHALQPKYINGKPVTCRKLVQYFKEYVNSFDGNTVPVANSILNANAKLICIEAAHEAKVAYCRGMDRAELERYKRLNAAKKVTGCASAMTACGDSALLGVGLGAAATGTVAATVLTLQTGLVSAGIVAIPISLATLLIIWIYVYSKPHIDHCMDKEPQ
ncbi:guanylate-binding protein [Teladorsagia circumcincta]|uniref:Guanylate-binding protein n=1 Tax=Teladorsagia circumcincta TaxID=45464 RepID=A0A2G9UF13_TELCI|nr:guanylate-binding protein [Teladorsagia circumcincta]